MLLNFNEHFKYLDGTELLAEKKMSVALADYLSGKPEGNINTAKAYDFAVSLFKSGEISLDDVDFKSLHESIDKSGFQVIAKEQLKRLMDAQKVAQEVKPE